MTFNEAINSIYAGGYDLALELGDSKTFNRIAKAYEKLYKISKVLDIIKKNAEIDVCNGFVVQVRIKITKQDEYTEVVKFLQDEEV